MSYCNVSYLSVDSKGLYVWLSSRGEKKHGRITARERSESQWAAVTGERHWRGIDKRLSRSRSHGWQLNSRMNGQPGVLITYNGTGDQFLASQKWRVSEEGVLKHFLNGFQEREEGRRRKKKKKRSDMSVTCTEYNRGYVICLFVPIDSFHSSTRLPFLLRLMR